MSLVLFLDLYFQMKMNQNLIVNMLKMNNVIPLLNKQNLISSCGKERSLECINAHILISNFVLNAYKDKRDNVSCNNEIQFSKGILKKIIKSKD